MSLLDCLLRPFTLLDYLLKLDGPLIPFSDTAAPVTYPAPVSATVTQDPAPIPPGSGAVAGPESNRGTVLDGPAAASPTPPRPGAGRHANSCLYIDDPWHRCVAADGFETSQECVASDHYRKVHAGLARCVCGHVVADHRDRTEGCRLCGCSYVEASKEVA